MSAPLWIFGYGSLVWRPDFAFSESRAACLPGWARRFWQGSTDHRGVPGAPGRVVTLVATPGARCWGRAFRVVDEEREAVLDQLDHREKGGYAREWHWLDPGGGEALRGLVYRATPENPNYLGPAPLEAMAAQVRASSGPSGPNREYVLRLAHALRELGQEDDEVFEIEAQLQR